MSVEDLESRRFEVNILLRVSQADLAPNIRPGLFSPSSVRSFVRSFFVSFLFKVQKKTYTGIRAHSERS